MLHIQHQDINPQQRDHLPLHPRQPRGWRLRRGRTRIMNLDNNKSMR